MLFEFKELIWKLLETEESFNCWILREWTIKVSWWGMGGWSVRSSRNLKFHKNAF